MIRDGKRVALMIFGLLFPVMISAGSCFGKVLGEDGNPPAGSVVRILGNDTVANTLNEVVVTATRTPKALKDVPVITRLVTSDEIKKSDASNIQELLTGELPGLEFGYTMSQETSLSMNGFGGSAVLFLVDGERLAGETMDNVDYSRLFLDDMDRVEIVKGASSALYGANAVGGVVNLITKESREPLTANVNSRYRRAGNEWRSGGNLNVNSGRWNSSTSVQHSSAETIRLTDAFDTESKIHEVFGGRTLNIRERLVCRINDNLRFIVRGGYFDRISNRANYDDRYKDYSGGIKSVWNISGSRTLEFSYGYDRYDKSRYVDNVRTNDHDYSNRQHIVHGLYNEFFGANCLTVGVDFMNDCLATYQFKDNACHIQNSFDIFAQFDYNPLSWLNLIASVREDYFSASKNNSVTCRLAAMFKLKGMSVRASYAGGFRAPTLKEMYMDFDMAGIQMIYGNPGLKPEKSHNLNVALEHNGHVGNGIMNGSYNLTASGYYNYLDSRITTTDFPGDADREEGAVYCNEDGVKIMGVDLTARYRLLMGLGFSFSYNYLYTAGRTVDSQFAQPRPHSATWRIGYDRQICGVWRLYAGLSGRYLSKPVSSHETDNAYSIWRLTVLQRVWKGMNINFIIDNIFNYKPRVYYWNSAPTSGRTYSVGLSFDINDFFKKK